MGVEKARTEKVWFGTEVTPSFPDGHLSLMVGPYARCQAIFRSTRAAFFDPNPTQLQTACSI